MAIALSGHGFNRADSGKIIHGFTGCGKKQKWRHPEPARDPSWVKCPQEEGFRAAVLLGTAAFLTFSASSLAAEGWVQLRARTVQRGSIALI